MRGDGKDVFLICIILYLNFKFDFMLNNDLFL